MNPRIHPRFTTLLLREWLQHRRAWLLLVALPPALMALLLALARVQIGAGDADAAARMAQLPPVGLAVMTIAVAAFFSFCLAWGSALIQASGLARRDQQDRSLEFWLSLPVGHAAALAAPMLAHLLLFPLAALAIGVAAGTLLTPLTLARYASLADWVALPWGAIAAATLALLARAALGLLLATVWLSPLLLLLMAASAWLGRWGLPALLAAVAITGSVLDKVYGNTLVWQMGRELFTQAGHAFIAAGSSGGLRITSADDAAQALGALPGWVAADAGRALQALAQPLLPAALALAAVGFALLWWRRARGA